MTLKKPWTPGRVIWWLLVGGLLGVIVSGLVENSDIFVISMMFLAIGAIFGAIRMMFK